MEKLKIGILGCGRLGTIVARAVDDGLLKEYELVGGVSRTFESAQELARRFGGTACRTMEHLLALRPDYVVEAACPAAVKEHGPAIVKQGCSLVTLSIGAFADADFYQEMQRLAAANGAKLHIASGAVGGFDVIRTAALMDKVTASIHSSTGPQYLKKTPVFGDKLKENETCEVFRGSAAEAIRILPCRVNVAVATALASAGAEDTEVVIQSVPGMVGDTHVLRVKGGEVDADLSIYSKTSDIAGWSVVSLLQNLVSPVQFF